MEKIEGIVFDKDGTLFDFEATWAPWAQQCLVQLCDGDRERAIQLGRAVGFDLTTGVFQRDSVVIAGTPEEIVDEFSHLLPGKTELEVIEIINSEAAAAPMAETVPLPAFFEELKGRGLKLGVATNDAEAPAKAHLSAVGALDLLDFVAGSDSGYGGKPAPGQLLAFCDAVKISAENAAMVGDSLHDLEAGRRAGFFRIGVLTGMASREDLEPFSDVVFNNIGEIPAWLDTIK